MGSRAAVPRCAKGLSPATRSRRRKRRSAKPPPSLPNGKRLAVSDGRRGPSMGRRRVWLAKGGSKLFNRQRAINWGKGYGRLAPEVLADYRAQFPVRIAAWEVIGLNVKIVNTATGAAGEYL